MLLRRTAVTALTTGVLLGLVGCSDDSAPSGSDDAATSTSPGEAEGESPSESEGESPSESEGDSADALSEENFAETVTAAQVEAGSAHIESNVTAQGQSLEVSGDYAGLGDPDALQLQLLTSLGGEKIEVRAVDQVFYVKSPQVAPNGKEWVKVEAGDSTNPLSQLFTATDPSNFTSYLAGVKKFQDKGTETVEGVETRHFSVTVDTATMLKQNPMFQGQDASALGLPKTVTSETYVDSENRPVRIEVPLGELANVEATFTDYGKDVAIEAPDPSTVGEFAPPAS